MGARDRYIGFSLSPRETAAAVMRFDPRNQSFDIWTVDLSGGSPSRVTFEQLDEGNPVWSPNGDSIAFQEIGRDIKKRLANGSSPAETILKANGLSWP